MSNLADLITKWGFTAILMKNLYNLKTPGFITENISANKIGSSRHIFLSENSISNIEIKLIEKFGNKAEQILYSIGKEFGFSYVDFMKGFNLKSPTRKIKISFIFRFFEAMYAKKIDYEIDWEKKTIILKLNQFIVCRKNGLGYLFTEGSAAGLWAAICEDKTIEAKQITCQGKKDAICEVIIAPKQIMEKKFKKIKSHVNFEISLINQQYMLMNKIIKKPFMNTISIDQLIKMKIATYKEGALKIYSHRFFPTECSFYIILEKKIFENFGEEGMQIIFNAVKEAAIELGKEFKKNSNEIESSFELLQKILSATGWGLSHKKTNKNNFELYLTNLPWVKTYNKSSFPYIKGLIHGFLEGISNKKIKTKFIYAKLTKQLEAKFNIEIF